MSRFSVLFLVLMFLLQACSPNQVTIETGLDVLLQEQIDRIKGKRLGIITNQTAVTATGEHIVDALSKVPGISIQALFAPEHGIRGDREGGEYIESYIDSTTGLKVFSLYGQTRKPTPAMLDSVDLLIFDIQDIGARFYTYISTMGLAMEAAAEKGIPFMVLDRPNPITGLIIEGPVLKPELKSFVGMYPIPIRHGLTVAELAQMINGEGWLKDGKRARLIVVPMRGWRRSMWFDQTGLPWVKPSPNIPDLHSALLYPGIALLEGVNVSEGRGTATPFQVIGAPWIDAERLKEELGSTWLYGIQLQTTNFSPISIEGAAAHPEYEGELCHGLRIIVYNRNIFRSVSFGIYLCSAMQKIFPESLQFRKGFLRLIGDEQVLTSLLSGKEPREIIASWEEELATFRKIRKQYLIYTEE